MALATQPDLEARLGRGLTDDELAQANALLDDVSAAVILYTGQKLARATYELRTRVKRGKVRLPQKPVHDVTAVTDRFGNAIEFTWDGLDKVIVDCCQFTGSPPIQVVDISYDAGPDTVPTPIVGLVSAIALRALGIDPTETAVTQESVDGYAFTIGSAGGGRAYGVLPSEGRVLAQFKGRRNIGSIQVAW